MGLASDFRRFRAAISPFYCNPFFRRCKYFFCKKPCFFEKISQRTGNASDNSKDALPETGKYHPQQPPGGPFPQKCPCGQSRAITQTDISLTDLKTQMQPCPE
jgi:hypothetical protein